ncbi:hypothetical protein J7W08_10250 [Methanococcoides orientis]|uniref:hypothetical protein n=1 Tax=Methanococcoides orientis TaxID=2822137 RepID=UPI001E4EAF07|nr:hypothetical protein [Methanococcoides orientis]UGV40435.1 hypothetical protein J7W08_10250 [Methanococcoides orientis]
MSKVSIVFVYNADSGLVNEMKDYVHKIVSPSSYGCNLCAITYGNAGMKSEWRSFVDDLPIPVFFLHKDEFDKKYNYPGASFPCAYLEKDNRLNLLITSDEMNDCSDLEDLKALVNDKLKFIAGN